MQFIGTPWLHHDAGQWWSEPKYHRRRPETTTSLVLANCPSDGLRPDETAVSLLPAPVGHRLESCATLRSDGSVRLTGESSWIRHRGVPSMFGIARMLRCGRPVPPLLTCDVCLCLVKPWMKSAASYSQLCSATVSSDHQLAAVAGKSSHKHCDFVRSVSGLILAKEHCVNAESWSLAVHFILITSRPPYTGY